MALATAAALHLLCGGLVAGCGDSSGPVDLARAPDLAWACDDGVRNGDESDVDCGGRSGDGISFPHHLER